MMIPNTISKLVLAAAWAIAAGWIASTGSAGGQVAHNPLRSAPSAPAANASSSLQPPDGPAESVATDDQPESPAPAADSPPELPSQPPAETQAGFLTAEELTRRRLNVEAASDLEPSVKADLLKQYAKAEEWLQAAAETARQIEAWKLEIEQAPAAIAAARQQLEQPLPEIETRFDPGATVEDLQKILEQHEEQLRTAREELAAREAAVGIRDRKSELVRLADEINKQLDELRKRLAAAPRPEESPAAALAQRSETEAQLTALDQQLRALVVEGRRLDAVAELLTLQRDLIQRRVSHLEKKVAAWQDAVARRRKIVAQAQVQEAQQVQEQDRAWQEIDPTLETAGTT
jgi:chromosome segregation ATPase